MAQFKHCFSFTHRVISLKQRGFVAEQALMSPDADELFSPESITRRILADDRGTDAKGSPADTGCCGETCTPDLFEARG